MVSYSCPPTMEPRLLPAAAVGRCVSVGLGAGNHPSRTARQADQPSRTAAYAAPVRAVVYEAVGAVAAVVDVPDPACPDDGVVLEVAATGVCRSDWHAWRGDEVVA